MKKGSTVFIPAINYHAVLKDDIEAVDLQRELVKLLEEEIQKEYMSEMLRASGWHLVAVKYQTEEISSWCNENIFGEYKYFSQIGFFFKDSKEANFFALRWLS